MPLADRLGDVPPDPVGLSVLPPPTDSPRLWPSSSSSCSPTLPSTDDAKVGRRALQRATCAFPFVNRCPSLGRCVREGIPCCSRTDGQSPTKAASQLACSPSTARLTLSPLHLPVRHPGILVNRHSLDSRNRLARARPALSVALHRLRLGCDSSCHPPRHLAADLTAVASRTRRQLVSHSPLLGTGRPALTLNVDLSRRRKVQRCSYPARLSQPALHESLPYSPLTMPPCKAVLSGFRE